MPFELHSPYLNSGYTWLRGNLHTHTTNSDGAYSPERTVEEYAKLGYDFLALTDHESLTATDDLPTPNGIVLIPSTEDGQGPHLLGVNIRRLPPRPAGRQAVIDAINEQGGFVVLNHPNWEWNYNHFPQEDLEELRDYAGIEIYNNVVEWLEGAALATDRWDMLLSRGRTAWGFAHDDAHRPNNIGKAWNVVQAASRTVEGVCEALRLGRFYASTGVEVRQIVVSGNSIAVQAPQAQRIRFVGQWGRQLHVADDYEAEYRPDGSEGGYVRVECYGRGMRCAWTQPILVEDLDAR